MASNKKSVGSTRYTRTGLIDTMNQLRAKTDRVILNLIYNPNSNKNVLQDIADIKKITKKLPNIVIEPHLFGDREATKAKGNDGGKG